MIRVEKFHPKDEIGCSHIQVLFDRENAYIRPVVLFNEEHLQSKVLHLGSLHRVLKIAMHTAQTNKVDLVALISEKYDRHHDIFY